MEIDVEKKYIDGEPNAYYKGFVNDNDYYKGYISAMNDLVDVLEAMPIDLFEKIEIPLLKGFLFQVARVCIDYIEEAMDYNKKEMVVGLIDEMGPSEWHKKSKLLFAGVDYDKISQGAELAHEWNRIKEENAAIKK